MVEAAASRRRKASKAGLAGSLGSTLTYTVTMTLLGSKGIATIGARTLLGAPGLTTRNKDATRSNGHRY